MVQHNITLVVCFIRLPAAISRNEEADPSGMNQQTNTGANMVRNAINKKCFQHTNHLICTKYSDLLTSFFISLGIYTTVSYFSNLATKAMKS